MKKSGQFLIPLVAALLVTALAASGALKPADRWMQDAYFQHPGVTSTDIVIIGIDENALEQFGPYNTWDRTVVASALEALAADPDNLPAVVAVDILYAGETTDEADLRLAGAAAALGNVVTASMAEYGDQVKYADGRAVSLNASAVVNYVQPYFELAAYTTQGHINAMLDTDGILRHALLYVQPENGRRVYSMAYETARAFMERQGKTIVPPPVNATGHFYVPMTAQPGDYYEGASIAGLISGELPAGFWANKIVLIGPYAASLQDAYFTSINKGVPMYGVEYQANVIQCLLEGHYKTEVNNAVQLAVLFALSAVAAFLFLRLRMIVSAGVCAGMIVLGVAGSYGLYQLGYITHILWLPTAALLLMAFAVADHYAIAARERRALALENARIGTELALAVRIQTSMLPKEFPPFPDRKEFDIFAAMTPAKEVGGDLYDFFLMDDDHLCLVIGDVSGKGVPAALFMMLSSSLIRHVAKQEKSPAAILKMVNEDICARNPEEMFVTVWLGVLEISTGILTAANAGHEYPVIRHPHGAFELLNDKHGFVLGGMSGVRYREYTVALEPGARFLVYTDGVAEATNAHEEMFGTDRMLNALNSAAADAPEEIVRSLDGAVSAFVGDAPQFDDLTMLCLAYDGPLSDEGMTKEN